METARINELRSWAHRLEERASNEETRAAAKAILMLTDEVDDLRQKLDAATSPAPAPGAPGKPAEPAAPQEDEAAEGATDDAHAWAAANDRLSGSFFSRVKRTFGFE